MPTDSNHAGNEKQTSFSEAENQADFLDVPLSADESSSEASDVKTAAKKTTKKLKSVEQQAEKISELLAEEVDDNPAMDSIFEKKELVDRLRHLPIWLLSFGVHVALMIFLALHYMGNKNADNLNIISQPGDEPGVDTTDLSDSEDIDIADFAMETFQEEQPVETPVAMVTDIQTPLETTLSETFEFSPTTNELVEPMAGATTGALSGRLEGKGRMLKSGGGNDASEKAVQLALEWIARHQLPNGSWSFNLADCPNCKGQCDGSGKLDAPNAATAMALLPFLGAGHTPTKGKYKKTVARGIEFLLQNGVMTENGYDMRDPGGRLYSHGLATIVFCEAYAMSDPSDRENHKLLQRAAQQAVAFIEYAQDPAEGGWRYQPREAGDTSVVGWQLMALKSGNFGGLSIRSNVPRKALNFLVNRVSYANQSRYGYTSSNGGTVATTAIGLLCRLFLDWQTTNPSLLAGADFLMSSGPDLNDPYFIYYATQLFHHIGGDRWKSWNGEVRDRLIALQDQSGDKAGSWFPSAVDGHGKSAGRLYVTSLFCMTLEVYYRHMPLYQMQESGKGSEFPL